MSDDVLKAVARKMCTRARLVHAGNERCWECEMQERALRDMGLGELLEAGHKLRERMSVIPTFIEDRAAIAAWDVAKQKVLS